MFDNRLVEPTQRPALPIQPEHVHAWRTVLNMHWPARPASFSTHHPGNPVRVRIIWELDGEEFVEGTATRWDADHVYVQLRDTARLQGNGVWVKPTDVYRASPEPQADVRLR